MCHVSCFRAWRDCQFSTTKACFFPRLCAVLFCVRCLVSSCLPCLLGRSVSATLLLVKAFVELLCRFALPYPFKSSAGTGGKQVSLPKPPTHTPDQTSHPVSEPPGASLRCRGPFARRAERFWTHQSQETSSASTAGCEPPMKVSTWQMSPSVS